LLKLKNIKLHFSASKDNLRYSGQPYCIDDLSHHRLIGFDRDLTMLKALEKTGWQISPADFKNRTDSLAMQIELTRQGAGICVTHLPIIERFNELQIILSDVPIPELEFWLVCHGDVQHNRKIRLMMDFLSDRF